MAFLFGKRKGAHGHREGTPNGPIPPAAVGAPGGGALGGPGGPTPSSSVNNSLNSLAGSVGATSGLDQRPVGALAGPPRPQQQQALQEQALSESQMSSPQQSVPSSQTRVVPPFPFNILRKMPKIAYGLIIFDYYFFEITAVAPGSQPCKRRSISLVAAAINALIIASITVSALWPCS